jgi:hypothetical protein
VLAGCFINGNGQLQGNGQANGNGSDNKVGNGNGDGNGSGNGAGNGGGTSSGPTDGTYDITTAGAGAIGPSEMTVAGSSATAFVAQAAEGHPSDLGCIRTTDRTTFTLEAKGDSVRGTLTVDKAFTGNGCPDETTRAHTFSGTRSAGGPDGLQGSWLVTGLDVDPVTLSVAAANGVVSITSTRADMSFAARKR